MKSHFADVILCLPLPPFFPLVFLPPKNLKSLHWAVLFSHQDQNQTRESFDGFFKYYKDPALSKVIRKAGIAAKVNQTQFKETPITHLKARMPRTPRILAPLRPQLKELYQAHVGIFENKGVVTFGKSWKTTLPLLTKSSSVSTSSLFQDVSTQNTFKHGARNPFLALYLEPTQVISSLKRGRAGSLTLPLQILSAVSQPKEGLSLTLGVDNQALQGVFSIPFDLVQKISSSFSGGLNLP